MKHIVKTIQQSRQHTVAQPTYHADAFSFLGKSYKQVSILTDRILGNSDIREKEKRADIFSYILKFWKKSYISYPHMMDIGNGLNIATYPFFAPMIRKNVEFGFYEQYRWDTYFQNLGIVLAGGHTIATEQLLNLAHAQQEYHRIPNALTTSFLSHAQPPLEALGLQYILKNASISKEHISKIVYAVENDLLEEWFDVDSGKYPSRQNPQLIEKYGLLSRHVSLHFNPLLIGCEDGKDHNWLTISYGSDYLPVQLNALLYSMLSTLRSYYHDQTLGNNLHKALQYENLQEKLYRDFQKLFWNESGKWKGFRNYSIRKGEEGAILYGDLAAEVWPLFVGIATQKQAEITLHTIQKYYEGTYGLAATSDELRKNGSIPNAPAGHWLFQWEYPNCWPPLMYIACEGLKKYGFYTEAYEYERRWILFIEKEFEKTGYFPEKSPFSSHTKTQPGLYGTKQGFGWTIGVYLAFVHDLAKNKVL